MGAPLPGAVLVLAEFATGETRTLTAGVATRIAARYILTTRILAVTVIDKAAKEMGDRVKTILASQAEPSWVGAFLSLWRPTAQDRTVGGNTP
jgi:DNA helicase-2/ATP-dependent DNA helicase PcrA